MIRTTSNIIILLIISSKLFSAEPFNIAQLDTVVKYIYNFEFELARDKTKALDIDEKYTVLPIAYSHYWEFLSGNEPEFNIKTCNNYIKNKTLPQKGDTLQDVYRVSVNLLQLRVHIANSNFVAPLLLFDDIHLFFEQNTPNSCSDFSMLYWGLYNYYISHTRENSFATRYILNDWPESSKLSGIAMLEKLSHSQSVFVKTEAMYFLTRIYLESEKNFEKASYYALQLTNLYPNNYIYKWFYLRTLYKIGDSEIFMTKRANVLKELSLSTNHNLEQKQHFIEIINKIEN